MLFLLFGGDSRPARGAPHSGSLFTLEAAPHHNRHHPSLLSQGEEPCVICVTQAEMPPLTCAQGRDADGHLCVICVICVTR